MSVEQYARPRRPIGVTILAILLILAGIFALLISLAVLVLGVMVIPLAGFLGVAVGAVAVIIAFLILSAGFALLSLKPWAWWLSVLVLVLFIGIQIPAILAGSLGFGIIVGALILVYLIAVRGHFR